jgi:dihydrofolate reductase
MAGHTTESESSMRKLVVSEFVSLDGVMEDPGGAESFEHGGWTMPYWCDELAVFKSEELFAADALLLGRVTYEGFAAAWPGRTDEAGFADHMNNSAKYVVSSTLKKADWNNSTILTGDLPTSVAAVKEKAGKDILVNGSATLVQGLIAEGLVDELRLEVYPVVLGRGKRLFGASGMTKFDLVAQQATSTGVLLLTYRRA